MGIKAAAILSALISSCVMQALTQPDSWIEAAEKFYYSNPDSSLYYASKALAGAGTDPAAKAEAQLSLARYFARYADSDTAELLCRRSMKTADSLGDKTLLARNYHLAGYIYDRRSDYDTAVSLYLKSIKIAESVGYNKTIADASVNLGIIFRYRKQFAKAIDAYKRALSIDVELGDSAAMAIDFTNTATAFESLNELDSAVHYYNRCLHICLLTGNNYGIALTHLNLGSLRENAKQFDLAREYYLKGLTAWEMMNDKEGLGSTHYYLASLERKLKNFTASKNHILEAIGFLKETQSNYDLLAAYQEAARIYSDNGEYSSAFRYQELYSDLRDSVFSEESSRQIAEMEAKYENEKSRRALERLRGEKQLSDLRASRQVAIRNSVIVFFILSVIITLLLFSRYRIRRRQIESELEKLNLEMKQRLLRAQMNPHFIFNSLNSIQSFISENQPETAEKYLARFAKLMRAILHQTSEEQVLLQDEMETLRLYLGLEQLRFDYKFTFTVECDGLDPSHVSIPPLLTQPFVENAILHGVRHADRQGRIQVTYRKGRGQTILCKVSDNGVGRQRAAEIKNAQAGHKSMGMEVTRDRLLRMAREIDPGIGVEMHDLDEGTVAAVTMPAFEKF